MTLVNKVILAMVLIYLSGYSQLQAQVVSSFNFSLQSKQMTGWINVNGEPSAAVRTATDPATGISISSVSTANWAPTNGVCAADGYGGGVTPSFFPSFVMNNEWAQYNYPVGGYNALMPQLIISGLNKDSVYYIRMTGSFIYASWNCSPVQYTVAGATVVPSQYLNTYNNFTMGVTFQQITPDSTGSIRVYVNTTASTNMANISGIQILSGSAIVGIPAVAITSPATGDILPEESNIKITATATESGNSISKVEFYADTAKIGEADTAPYTITWNNPNEGHYLITAKATDASGTTNIATINISVESLTSFWSMTGNIGMNADSNFVGNVDSVRLAFRTKNKERMSISPLGNVGIGVDTPTAQLHTTGTVRLAGLLFDSAGTRNRVLVGDSSGNLYYRNAATLGLTIGDGLGQTAGGLALGDSIPGPGPHSFNSNRYQYLNGHLYSIGGSVNDPVNRPAFRIYNNGDLTAGTTMDTSVNTNGQAGLRYYAKLGLLQLGGSDRMDTTVNRIAYQHQEGSGILINSDNTLNNIKGHIYCSLVAASQISLDSAHMFGWSIIVGGSHVVTNDIQGTLLLGHGHIVSGAMNENLINGVSNSFAKPSSVLTVNGFLNVMQDSANGSLVTGGFNQYGGTSQFVAGNELINRTPYGTTIGNSNVDFASQNYTGAQGIAVPATIAQYPLFAIGNGSNNLASVRSNALTVLYNGRTQINTNGFSNALAQTDVTPKAALEVVSNNSGVLLPKLTTAQRNAIAPADLQNGLLLYNTDSTSFQYYNGSAWNTVGIGANTTGHWLQSGSNAYDSLDNIGIGTSNTQGYKLAVNGNAIFTKITVKPQSIWPDYVFTREYRLPELKDIEKYIKANNHLPGIISAKEAEKVGIDLGENQSAILKKIEELTLYAIRQDKELEELKQVNKSLDEQNGKLKQQAADLKQQQQEINELKEMVRKLSTHN